MCAALIQQLELESAELAQPLIAGGRNGMTIAPVNLRTAARAAGSTMAVGRMLFAWALVEDGFSGTKDEARFGAVPRS